MCVTEAELTQPAFYFCTQLGNIVSDQTISKHPRNSQRMINRITKRPPKSPERFEGMWQGFKSLSCFFGGRPRGASKIKGGPSKGRSLRRNAARRRAATKFFQDHPGDERHTSHFFWGGLSPASSRRPQPRNSKGIRPHALWRERPAGSSGDPVVP